MFKKVSQFLKRVQERISFEWLVFKCTFEYYGRRVSDQRALPSKDYSAP